MAQVFLSYDRRDGNRAQSIAQALEKAGHSVWWDRHIKGGSQYAKEIETALKAADVVVALWSERSVESAWVRDEAASGRDRGRFVPLSLDGCEPPLGFRQFQTIDLPGGRLAKSAQRSLLAAVDSVVGTPVVEPRKKPAPVSPALSTRLIWVVATALIISASALFLLRNRDASDVPTVLVTAADASPATGILARDLLVSLGKLQSARSGDLQLVGTSGASGSNPDLILEASGATGPGTAAASLVLLAARDRSLLWSRDFNQESGSQADLKQQVAYTAARVLDCSSQGLNWKSEQLDRETLKLYLNGCAQQAEIGFFDPTAAIPALLEVVDRAPRFEAGWAQLLLAEAEALNSLDPGNRLDRARASLRGHIEAARKINSKMPEIGIAELSFLAPNAFGERMTLLDSAARDAPDHVQVLAARSTLLRSVGRLRDAIADASRAAELDPVSPALRGAYISALLYGGRLDAAAQELRLAEQLWPGTEALRDIQYRYHLRYGDPRVARRLAPDSATGAQNLYLAARENPSPANVERMTSYMWGRVRSGEAGPAGASGLGIMMQGLGEFDRTEDLFQLVGNWPKPGDLAIVSDIYFRPALRGFVRDPRFIPIAKRAGLVDYWRSSGKWPDFCFEPDQPYDCKAEAAKLS